MPRKQRFRYALSISEIYVPQLLIDEGVFKDMQEAQEAHAFFTALRAHHNKQLAEELIKEGVIEKIE